MELKDKYPTLEQSKRIAELLGDNAPKSERVWFHALNDADGNPVAHILNAADRGIDWYHANIYPAYDLAELGSIILGSNPLVNAAIYTHYQDSSWNVSVTKLSYHNDYDTEVQARAALVIHLFTIATTLRDLKSEGE